MVLEAIVFNRAVVFLALLASSHGFLEEHDTTSMLQTQRHVSSTEKSLEENRALIENASRSDEVSHIVQENKAIVKSALHVEETSDKMAESAEENTRVADNTTSGGTPPGCRTLYDMGVWGVIILSAGTNVGLLLGSWYAGHIKLTEANFKVYTVVVGMTAAYYLIWQGLHAPIPCVFVLIALVYVHYKIRKGSKSKFLAWPLTIACLLVSVFYIISATYDYYWLYNIYCAVACVWWLAAAVAGNFLIKHILKGGDNQRALQATVSSLQVEQTGGGPCITQKDWCGKGII